VRKHPQGPRAALAAGLLATTLLVSAACTSDSERSREDVAPSALPDRSTASTPTIEARPVPMTVRVTRTVGGELPKRSRRRLEHQVSRVLSGYFDAAYLGGEYPRSDFAGALAAFSRGARERAASDRGLLTNAGVGARTRSVLPRTKQARLDVLVPRRLAVGLTARVRLVFLQEQVHGPTRRVTVKGRLLLNRKRSGPWQIFGYDVSRSSVPARNGGRR
jgi:hypothetical protein